MSIDKSELLGKLLDGPIVYDKALMDKFSAVQALFSKASIKHHYLSLDINRPFDELNYSSPELYVDRFTVIENKVIKEITIRIDINGVKLRELLLEDQNGFRISKLDLIDGTYNCRVTAHTYLHMIKFSIIVSGESVLVNLEDLQNRLNKYKV